jgi:transcriptional regulator with XRE-family HTH domain
MWCNHLFYAMVTKGNNLVSGSSPDQVLKKLGARIKSLREQRGYSNYEKFAYEHEFSRAQFGRYERGENLTFVTLLKIVNSFEMTLEEFFSEGFGD